MVVIAPASERVHDKHDSLYKEILMMFALHRAVINISVYFIVIKIII